MANQNQRSDLILSNNRVACCCLSASLPTRMTSDLERGTLSLRRTRETAKHKQVQSTFVHFSQKVYSGLEPGSCNVEDRDDTAAATNPKEMRRNLSFYALNSLVL